MASGYGAHGSEGRCAPAWREFAKCATEAEDRSVCFKFREDYIECLHHKKEATAENEVARVRAERYAKAKEEMLKELWSFSWVTDPKYAPKKEGK